MDKQEKLKMLEAKVKLIRSGNTAIMPDGVIVARGTPGSMNYDSANVELSHTCRNCGYTGTSRFTNGAWRCPECFAVTEDD